MHLYGLTIFLSAVLLFQVQPLVARLILPWFGGTASVWTGCMLFFQTGLLLGYAYAHALRRWLSPCHGWLVHIALLSSAAVFANPVPPPSLQPLGAVDLLGGVWGILCVTIGLPFVALSATSPLIQAWQSETHRECSPYPLYAVSNAGSLLALIAFPFLLEPYLTTGQQGVLWQRSFWLFAVLCVASGFRVIRIRSWSDVPLTFAPDKGFGLPAAAHIGFFRVMAWTVLPMIGSVVLLATTNLLCQEIASVPLLWVLPLTLYLLSFIVCFNYPRFYQRWLFVPILTLSSVIAVVIVLLSVFAGATLQIGALLTVCLAANMTCHGELARLMPPSRELTKFYLMLALGGALGGVLVAVVAPRLFDGFYEFQLGLLASLLVLPTAGYFDGRFGSAYPQRSGLRLVQLWAGAGLLVFAIAIVASSLYYLLDPRLKPHQIHRERNEYGVLAVEELHGYRKFVHGRTEHGGEYISSDKLNFGSYYHPGSGVAVAIEAARNTAYVSSSDRRSRRLNVGVVGLGVGGILTWGNAGDAFVFFELDPAVERIAKQYFGYFQRTKAFTKVVLGDGRIQLDRRAAWLGETRSGPDHPDSFDVLVLDAFASDSIPIHLMTAECYQTYLQNLRQGGILVAHITNRFVDLRPVVYHHAIENGLTPILLETKKTETSPETRWVLMTRSQELAQIFQGHPNQVDWPKDLRPIRWTDDRASLWDVIRWSNSIEWSAIVENQNRLRNRRTIRPKK